MAKQTSGILGKVTGKVGGVIGAAWKSTPYFRAYAKPANPKTPAQLVQRGKMGFCVGNAKLVKATIITPYWNPFQKKMSGYNRFIQKNIKLVSDVPAYSELAMGEGDLELGPGLLSTSYDTATGEAAPTFNATTMGNGETGDSAIFVVIDTANSVAFINSEATRDEASGSFNIGAGRVPAELQFYLFFTRGSGSALIVSPSSTMLGEAPV